MVREWQKNARSSYQPGHTALNTHLQQLQVGRMRLAITQADLVELFVFL